MIQTRIKLLFFCLCCWIGGIAAAYCADQPRWIDGGVATFQTLDKVTARIAEIDAEIGSKFRFGTLEIVVQHCAFRPPEIPPEHAAFVEIYDIPRAGQSQQNAPEQVFSGWMFASSPAISGLEHAVYDVTLLSCAK